MIIVAVDPGMMCGWAIAHLDLEVTKDTISAGQAASDDWCDWVENNISEDWLLIVEKFTITARTAQMDTTGAVETLGVRGVMKHLARRAGATFNDAQTPSAAKRFATDAQLKKLGLWKPGQDHARDALRHLVLGVVTHGTGHARDVMIQSLA